MKEIAILLVLLCPCVLGCCRQMAIDTCQRNPENCVNVTDSNGTTVMRLQDEPELRLEDIVYLGCFKDTKEVRALDGFEIRDKNMTNDMCILTCREKGFAFAGTEHYDECYCGNSYDTFGPSTGCRTPCDGDPGQKCGGFWALTVHTTGLRIPAEVVQDEPEQAAEEPAAEEPAAEEPAAEEPAAEEPAAEEPAAEEPAAEEPAAEEPAAEEPAAEEPAAEPTG